MRVTAPDKCFAAFRGTLTYSLLTNMRDGETWRIRGIASGRPSNAGRMAVFVPSNPGSILKSGDVLRVSRQQTAPDE